MEMTYRLSIYHGKECLEEQESPTPFPDILPGEQFLRLIEGVGSPSGWWIVRKRQFGLYRPGEGKALTILYVDPDPNLGDPQI